MVDSQEVARRADVERLGLAKVAEQIRGETEEPEARRYAKRIEEAMKVKRLLEGAARGAPPMRGGTRRRCWPALPKPRYRDAGPSANEPVRRCVDAAR